LIFPKRLAQVTMPDVADQFPKAAWTMAAGQAAFIGLLMQAFVGTSIVLIPLVALPVLTGQVPRVLGPRLPESTWFRRFVPRSSVNTLFMSLVGVGVSHLLAHNVTSSFWLVTGQILIMLGVVFLYNIAFCGPGEDWKPSWPQRCAGMVLLVLTALQVTGHLVK
jgi:hypothetical protein